MSSEVPRVYKELIDEVIRATEEDNYQLGIDKNVLDEIRNTWIAKLCEYTDINEYKIRHGYPERYGMDGYFEPGAYANYQEYSPYREYPGREYAYSYSFYRDKDDKEDRGEGGVDYNQYDGLVPHRSPLDEPEPREAPPNPDEEELDSNELTESDCGIDNENDSTKNIMLCLFDKVTRVKDKRRCTLKHGFLSIGRTDYIFSVANGDLEW